jgi:hypothetical protein
MAQYDYLIFLDDDCTVAADWLAHWAQAVQAYPEHLIGGQTNNILPQNLFSEASQILAHIVYAHFNAHPAQPAWFASNNMGVPRARFLALGGFQMPPNTYASEDRLLCMTWRAAGYPLRYCPELHIGHGHELTWRTFLLQHYSYGQGAAYLHCLTAHLPQGGFQPEGKFYLRWDLWVCLPLQQGILRGSALIVLLFCTQIMVIVGYLSIRRFNARPQVQP